MIELDDVIENNLAYSKEYTLDFQIQAQIPGMLSKQDMRSK